MKFIVFTDTHIRTEKPIRRTDPDFLSTVLGKFEYVIAKANELEVDAILHCGDLGNRHDWHRTVPAMTGVMSILKNNNRPFIVIPGQHDVQNHNIPTWRTSAMGILEEAGFVTVLHGGDSLQLGDVRIFGYGYNEQETHDLLEGRVGYDHTDKSVKIGLVHASIGAEETFGWESIKHQNIKALDYAFFGDIHEGFEPHEFKSGCVACSAGSMLRQSKNEVDRIPQYIYFELQGDEAIIQYEDIPHLPGRDVFDLTEIEVTEVDSAQAYKAALERVKDYKEEDPKMFVKRIARVSSIEGNPVEMVLAEL